jgi:hypothetical protein
LAAGDSGGGVKLAQEERALRQMMTRFVEASFALRFGSPEQAASQMAEAVTLGSAASAERNAGFDASAELSRADGFDVHLSLPDSIRAFAALSQITAGEPAKAIRTIVAITSPDTAIPGSEDWVFSQFGQKAIRECVASLQSPLAAYAMAASLEAVIDRVDLARLDEMQPLLQLAIDAQKSTDTLLAATRVAGRYPHIHELNNQLGQRLSNPQYHQENAATAIAKGAISEAIDGLRAALRRQPREHMLWEQLLSLEIGRLTGEHSATGVLQLKKELEYAGRVGLITKYQQNFYSGELCVLQGHFAEATTLFEQAAMCSKTSLERALAIAKVTAARIRKPEVASNL